MILPRMRFVVRTMPVARPCTVVLALAGSLAIGGIAVTTVTARDDPKPAQAADEAKVSPLKTLKPGDYVYLEVLEALPGRPLSGVRRIRTDGTVSLGFYGDLPAAGRNRIELKKALISHMLRWLLEDTLGLEFVDVDTGKIVKIQPEDSDRVFVDDHLPEAR